VFHRQQQNVSRSGATKELSAVGIPFPTDGANKPALGRAKCDQVATAAVIRPDDELLRIQLGESVGDVVSPEGRAIAPDRDHFLVAEACDCFDGVLKAGCEISTDLAMNIRGRSAGDSA